MCVRKVCEDRGFLCATTGRRGGFVAECEVCEVVNASAPLLACVEVRFVSLRACELCVLICGVLTPSCWDDFVFASFWVLYLVFLTILAGQASTTLWSQWKQGPRVVEGPGPRMRPILPKTEFKVEGEGGQGEVAGRGREKGTRTS